MAAEAEREDAGGLHRRGSSRSAIAVTGLSGIRHPHRARAGSCSGGPLTSAVAKIDCQTAA